MSLAINNPVRTRTYTVLPPDANVFRRDEETEIYSKISLGTSVGRGKRTFWYIV